MELRARLVLEGAFSGRHRGVRQGPSLEFAGHRSYAPGDEWRRIDWKVFAKTDRWMVREQQEETNLRSVLLLDVSRSMAFASPKKLPKIQYAAILTAALGYLLIRQGESVGLGLFSDGLRFYFPPKGGGPCLARLLELLENVRPEGTTDPAASFQQVLQRLPRRSLVTVVSDFLGEPDGHLSAVKALLARKHEVLALQILDAEERDLFPEGDFLLEDMETGEKIKTSAEELGPLYKDLMERRLEKFERGCVSLGVDFCRFQTHQPLDSALSLFIQKRARTYRRAF